MAGFILHPSSFILPKRTMAMLVIPGQPGNDLCDPLPRMSRRELLRVGGSGLLASR
jgi:hypothetical protein